MDRDKHIDAIAERPIFSAVITPHRSLGPRGFRILMLMFCLASLFASVVFFMLGAWPVIGFFGLDVLLLYLFFRWNYRTARAREEVLLTPLSLLIRKVSHWGDKREWHFNPLWVRLKRDEDDEFGLIGLAVEERARRLDVAGFLSPAERAGFADAFSAALAEARRGPRFS